MRRTADDGEIFEAVPESIGFTLKYGHHPALNDAGRPALFADGDHLAVALAWVEELAGRATRTGRCFDPRILGLLEQQNSAFFEWLPRSQTRLATLLLTDRTPRPMGPLRYEFRWRVLIRNSFRAVGQC